MNDKRIIEAIVLDNTIDKPAYRQLYDQITLLIGKGVLNNGDRLPSIRSLTLHLNLNPNTIARAFWELERAKLIETRRGIGNFVAADAAVMLPNESERAAILEELYTNLVSMANSRGITTDEVADFLATKVRNLRH